MILYVSFKAHFINPQMHTGQSLSGHEICHLGDTIFSPAYNVMLINQMFNAMIRACRESIAANTAALTQREKHSSVIKCFHCTIKCVIKHFNS